MRNLDLNLSVPNPGRVGFRGSIGSDGTNAGPNVEGPPVHWARHVVVFEGPGSEGCPAVRALVVDAIEFTVNVPERQLLSVDADTSSVAGWQAAGIRHRNEAA